MRRSVLKLGRLFDSRLGSVPLQYAIVAAGTALITMLIVQTASNKVAEKLDAVTSALKRL